MKEKNDYVIISTAICRNQKEHLMQESYQRSMKVGKRISESSIIRKALDQYFDL